MDSNSASSLPLELQVDVVSDFICPWCYLGSLRLAQALMKIKMEYPSLDIQVRWWPRVLAPELENCQPPLAKRDMYLRRFKGSEAALKEMVEQFEVMLAPFPEGGYTIDGVSTATFKAHRLSQWARTVGTGQTQWLLSLELFQAYHMFGYNLEEDEVLVRAAKRAGLDEDETRTFLNSDELDSAVRAMAADIRAALPLSSLFSGGVPHFLVQVGDMSLEIPGAQDIDYFVSMFKKMISKAQDHQADPNIATASNL
mmetsp:Transcript_20974/g.41121  ORF Transcript_20974/g.41121 Transcript_20974/m.41121 type:complete len:255 (+) Transcript_20974:89-853(+)